MWFQSTHSLRSATLLQRLQFQSLSVSIHALLAECDVNVNVNVNVPHGFNPRTPCGVRPQVAMASISYLPFQSTHSLRSATLYLVRHIVAPPVSIHALLAECDCVYYRHRRRGNGFNPRTPCGVRHSATGGGIGRPLFQSTHSLRSATRILPSPPPGKRVSIHALLAECDATGRALESVSASFNPRTPCGVRRDNPEMRTLIK